MLMLTGWGTVAMQTVAFRLRTDLSSCKPRHDGERKKRKIRENTALRTVTEQIVLQSLRGSTHVLNPEDSSLIGYQYTVQKLSAAPLYKSAAEQRVVYRIAWSHATVADYG